MQSNKKALVIEGGGSRGVFSLGVTDTFINSSYNPFHIHLGVSMVLLFSFGTYWVSLITI